MPTLGMVHHAGTYCDTIPKSSHLHVHTCCDVTIRNICKLNPNKITKSTPLHMASMHAYIHIHVLTKYPSCHVYDNAQRIFPSVCSEGVDLLVPMPGHAPANASEEARMEEVRRGSTINRINGCVCSPVAVWGKTL